MFKKLHAVFRPNHHGHQVARTRDYHSACTVKLVRSTSLLVLAEPRESSSLKRSTSSAALYSYSELTRNQQCYYHRAEERAWLYVQNQECLEYLQELVALRRHYTKSISDFHNSERKENLSAKKKPAPQPPQRRALRPEPSAPPIPNEKDTLQFFDEVIASCDPEPRQKPHMDNGHADVDFIVATSTTDHDLHSNWVLRDPRRISLMKSPEINAGQGLQPRKDTGSTGSRRRLQRNPIHLPKVVESAFQTLRFKPKLKKKD